MNEKFLTFLGNALNEEGKEKMLNYIKDFEKSEKSLKNKEDKKEFNSGIDEILNNYSK